MENKCKIAICLADLYLKTSNFDRCKELLDFTFSYKVNNSFHQTLSELYSQLGEKSAPHRIECEKNALTLEYGPTFIKLGRVEYNKKPCQLTLASQYFQKAIVTNNHPQTREAIDELKKCLSGISNPDTLPCIHDLILFMRHKKRSHTMRKPGDSIKNF